ncbi:hypothetical protein ACFVDH_23465 [Streptomyces sp. NPDC057674]|uniref:hypothetical protein n=1 Tax=Streptomyces sp. NPDC057674 TaxID=3346203 RepID=UPI0036913858
MLAHRTDRVKQPDSARAKRLFTDPVEHVRTARAKRRITAPVKPVTAPFPY